MIIGLTGTLGAGKGAVVEFFKKKQFKHFSVRDYLIQEIKKRGLPVNRDNMVIVANQLREMNSPSYIVEQLYEKAKQKTGDCIIESIRTIGEVKALRKKDNFYLIAVDAEPETRYSRILIRQSETDNISYDEFLKNEKREMFSNEPTKQNLSACIKMADFVLENNKSIDELHKQAEKILEKIQQTSEKQKKYKRLSWDEYFMKITAVVAERSTCLRHNVGAVIVKDKRILSTGYNGAVRGAKDCLELGCKKDELKIESGTGDEQCRAVHAEQNAIIQAALHGINIKKATLYCTTIPCRLCAKQIVNAGIKEVVTYSDYLGARGSEKFLEENNVILRKISRPKNIINFKD